MIDESLIPGNLPTTPARIDAVTVQPSPEQIRDNKLGLMRSFIGLTKSGQMEPEEATEYFGIVKGRGFITEEDEQMLISELNRPLK